MPDNPILIRIRELCNQRGWSLYKLSKESGIAYSSLNNIFLRNTQPSIPTLEKICLGFGIQLSDFFSESFSKTSANTINSYILTKDEEALVLGYRALSYTNKSLLVDFLILLKNRSLKNDNHKK